MGPLGIILLPRVSSALSKGIDESLRKKLSLLIQFTLFYGTITSIALSQFSNIILSLWLGTSTSLAGKASEILLLSTPGFLLCAILRSPIDAIAHKGYNSFIYAIGVGGLIGTFLLMISIDIEPILASAWAFFSGYLFSAIASYLVASKIFSLNIFSKEYIASIIISNLTIYGIITLIPFEGNLRILVSMIVFVILMSSHLLISKEEWLVRFRTVLFDN